MGYMSHVAALKFVFGRGLERGHYTNPEKKQETGQAAV